MAYPDPPPVPGLAAPPGCCCSCGDILAKINNGTIASPFGTVVAPGYSGGACSGPARIWPWTAFNQSIAEGADCLGLKDRVLGGCPTLQPSYPAGSTYMVGMYWPGAFNYAAVIYLMIKPDLTADLFVRLNFSFGPTCQENNAREVWSYLNYPLAFDANCRISGPEVGLSLDVNCSETDALSVSVGFA